MKVILMFHLMFVVASDFLLRNEALGNESDIVYLKALEDLAQGNLQWLRRRVAEELSQQKEAARDSLGIAKDQLAEASDLLAERVKQFEMMEQPKSGSMNFVKVMQIQLEARRNGVSPSHVSELQMLIQDMDPHSSELEYSRLLLSGFQLELGRVSQVLELLDSSPSMGSTNQSLVVVEDLTRGDAEYLSGRFEIALRSYESAWNSLSPASGTRGAWQGSGLMAQTRLRIFWSLYRLARSDEAIGKLEEICSLDSSYWRVTSPSFIEEIGAVGALVFYQSRDLDGLAQFLGSKEFAACHDHVAVGYFSKLLRVGEFIAVKDAFSKIGELVRMKRSFLDLARMATEASLRNRPGIAPDDWLDTVYSSARVLRRLGSWAERFGADIRLMQQRELFMTTHVARAATRYYERIASSENMDDALRSVQLLTWLREESGNLSGQQLFQLGNAEFRLGKFDAAARSFTLAITGELSRESRQAAYELRVEAHRKSDSRAPSENSRILWTESLRILIENYPSQRSLAALYEWLAESVDAETALATRLIESFLDRAVVMGGLSSLSALPLVREYLEKRGQDGLDEDDLESVTRLAKLFQMGGEPEAIKMLQQAGFTILNEMATEKISAGQPLAALNLLEVWIRDNPSHLYVPDAVDKLLGLYLTYGKCDEFLRVFQGNIAMIPEPQQSLRKLNAAECLLRQYRFSESIVLLKDVARSSVGERVSAAEQLLRLHHSFLSGQEKIEFAESLWQAKPSREVALVAWSQTDPGSEQDQVWRSRLQRLISPSDAPEWQRVLRSLLQFAATGRPFPLKLPNRGVTRLEIDALASLLSGLVRSAQVGEIETWALFLEDTSPDLLSVRCLEEVLLKLKEKQTLSDGDLGRNRMVRFRQAFVETLLGKRDSFSAGELERLIEGLVRVARQGLTQQEQIRLAARDFPFLRDSFRDLIYGPHLREVVLELDN